MRHLFVPDYDNGWHPPGQLLRNLAGQLVTGAIAAIARWLHIDTHTQTLIRRHACPPR